MAIKETMAIEDAAVPDAGGAWTKAQPWITTAGRVGLAGVLGYAGWAKVTEPPALQKLAVSSYQILPDSLVAPVGFGLPILELVLAVLLLLGFGTRFTGAFSGLLMIIFIGGIISVWSRGLSIDCGCFGSGGAVEQGQTRYLQEILRDTGFLALAAWITAFPRSKLALDRLLGLYKD
ncbi:MauE/DoxX family redox-associated membrane protein [Actinomadura alba]|nr:MauE/DoxX family redox-associated membrane protein [Actinomadura alba]